MTVTDYKYYSLGQTPGQLYTAQVIDQDGNGLFAGWFYLDADGKQIMDDKVTDRDGYFHFTVPAHNHEKIFVEFYGTDEYEPIVKTFEEIVQNPLVVLPKKKPGVSTEMIIGITGLGLTLFALNKNKKMGSIKTKWDSLRKNPNTGKVGIGIAIALGAAGLIYYIFKYKPTPEQTRFLDDARNRLAYLASELGIVPSMTILQLNTFASQIVRAVDKCGTDEATIYRVFNSLNNEADFWQLCISFGIAKYDGCFEGSLPSWNVNYTLPESLASDLSPSQVSEVNQILQNRNINIIF